MSGFFGRNPTFPTPKIRNPTLIVARPNQEKRHPMSGVSGMSGLYDKTSNSVRWGADIVDTLSVCRAEGR